METTLYFGGPIVTLEEPQYAQALVERGGRIAYVGDREEAERLAGPGARRVDLEGRALLPAFLDPHSHLLACAYARLQVPLGECAGWGEITDRLAKHVQERGVQPGEWVKGTGYDQNALAEGAAPDRFCLDRACPHNPVVIQHASGHAGVFNTLALERLGGARAPEEEPMKRHPHPIPCPADCPSPPGAEALDRVLEELACQNQLLLELLSAVNGLTAAVLSIQGRL